MATPHSDGPSLLPFPSHLTIHKHAAISYLMLHGIYIWHGVEKENRHAFPTTQSQIG
jgi:hypothetical protein